MKYIKKAISFLFETSYDRNFQRGMGLVGVDEDEVNLSKRSSKMDSFRSMDLYGSDFYMSSESSEIHGSPRYKEFEDNQD